MDENLQQSFLRFCKLNQFEINPKQVEILNCGYNQGISVKQVANEFKKHTNKKVKIIEVKKRSGDLGKIIASNARLLKFISWRPKYKKLSLMVKSSIKWEKKLKSFK